MTDEELKALVAGLAISQQETDKQLKGLGAQTDKQLKMLTESQQETDKQLKALRESQQETDKQLKTLRESQQETDKQLKALRESQQETDHQLKELGKQIGGLNNKFGDFTEGLAWPSMRKILEEDLGMDTVAPRLKRRLNGKALELDVLGYTNSKVNKAYIVEVKSRLNEQSIAQILNTLKQFPKFFPEHRGKILHGILAFVDFREDFLAQAEKSGLYLAHIHEDFFQIISSPNFQPKNFHSGNEPSPFVS